jgi:hypothetical protein
VVHTLKTVRRKSKLAKQSPRENFDQLLLEAIDEGLSSLGEAAKTSIYFHLEGRFNIKKQEIPSKLNDFSNALERIFGLGARHFEILFMKKLHAKFEVTFKWPTYEWPLSKWIVPEMTFQEYVRLMRESFEAENNPKMEFGVLINEHAELQK